MRIVILLVIVFGVYVFLTRQAPVARVVEQVTGVEAARVSTAPAGSIEAAKKSGYGRQMGRAQDTLQAVKGRSGAGEF